MKSPLRTVPDLRVTTIRRVSLSEIKEPCAINTSAASNILADNILSGSQSKGLAYQVYDPDTIHNPNYHQSKWEKPLQSTGRPPLQQPQLLDLMEIRKGSIKYRYPCWRQVNIATKAKKMMALTVTK